mgnify:CR=1 FL=1
MTFSALAIIVVHDPIALVVVLVGAIVALAAVFIIIAAVGSGGPDYRSSHGVTTYESDDMRTSPTINRTQNASASVSEASDAGGTPYPKRRYRIDRYGQIHEE